MTVVVIVGILATVGVASFRRQIFGSKTAEAMAMIQSIRSAEERWRAENLRYLNVSKDLTWYPATPTRSKHAFYNAGACTPAPDPSQDCRWKLLNPTVTGPVEYGYMVTAGAPSETPTMPMTEASPTGFTNWGTTPGEHWYVVQAIGDADGDGKYSKFVASSFRTDVIQEAE